MHSALSIHIQNLDKANRYLAWAVRTRHLDLAGAAAAAIAAATDGTSGLRKLAVVRPTGPVALMRGRRPTLPSSSGNAAAAVAAATLLESSLPAPPELQAARNALSSAVAMCLRQD